jgi:serine/threonine-protein kinase
VSAPHTAEERERLLDEVVAAYLRAAAAGRAPSRSALIETHPELAGELTAFFADADRVERLVAPLRPTPPQRPGPVPGSVMGDYELLEELAAGPRAVVWKARQVSQDRVVALKLFGADSPRSPAEWERLVALDHPHIVPTYEAGERDGMCFLSMKLVEGGNLAQHRHHFRGAAREAARLVAMVARAVQHAHERRVVHGGLKPANVLVRHADGGARFQVTAEDQFRLSRLTSNLSPLVTDFGQARGRPATVADDVRGLGAILYELLTGCPPFETHQPAEPAGPVPQQAPPAPRRLDAGIDRDLGAVCLLCLRQDPQAGYGSAAAVAEDLERFLAGKPVLARPPGLLRRLGRWCHRLGRSVRRPDEDPCATQQMPRN